MPWHVLCMCPADDLCCTKSIPCHLEDKLKFSQGSHSFFRLLLNKGASVQFLSCCPAVKRKMNGKRKVLGRQRTSKRFQYISVGCYTSALEPFLSMFAEVTHLPEEIFSLSPRCLHTVSQYKANTEDRRRFFSSLWYV